MQNPQVIYTPEDVVIIEVVIRLHSNHGIEVNVSRHKDHDPNPHLLIGVIEQAKINIAQEVIVSTNKS
jgi:hypothetical protein